MTVAFWLKLILLCIEGVSNAVTWRTKEEHKQRVDRIKSDPVTEWNTRFGRLRESRWVDPVEQEPELSATIAGFTGGDTGGGDPPEKRHGSVTPVLRERGDTVPVITVDTSSPGDMNNG